MKPLSYSLIAAALACGLASAQTTAYTTPVGYITCNVAGTPAGFTSADTYISPSLIESSEYAGVTVSALGKELTFTSGVPATFGTAYVLEITSGASEGWWSTVMSSTATTITLNDAFPAGLSAGVAVSVRKHSTLLSFLGNNTPGFVTFNGADPSDEVQIFNPVTQGAVPYAFVSGADLGDPAYPNGAWLNLGTSLIDNGAVIEPGSAIRVKRVAAGALAFTTVGTVKTTKTQVDLYKDYNWLGTLIANGRSLNGMLLNKQLRPYDGVSPDYDELQFLGALQGTTPYAAYDDGLGGSMLNLATSADGGADIFKEGTGAVVLRIGGGASTITIPGTVVAP
jgi:hypothetical protein